MIPLVVASEKGRAQTISVSNLQVLRYWCCGANCKLAVNSLVSQKLEG